MLDLLRSGSAGVYPAATESARLNKQIRNSGH
jgi:hypothetical protein